MRVRLNRFQIKEIADYVWEYKERRIIGTYWHLAEALEVALKEIKLHRKARRKKRNK